MSILSPLTRLQVCIKFQAHKDALTTAAALDGISGSWVIQEGERNIRVYGQVVAKDSFGDVYIVPMVDILHDVGKVLNVKMASLNDQEGKDVPAVLRSHQHRADHVAERPKTSPRPSCFVPFRRDPDFVDRAALLDQIRERCSAPASRVALVGLGGVGYVQRKIFSLIFVSNVSTESRSWLLNTVIVLPSARQRHGCSGCTPATRRDWSKVTKR